MYLLKQLAAGAAAVLILTAATGWCGAPALPNEFGSLVPVYESARLTDTRYTRDGVRAYFSSDSGFDAVTQFYRAHLGKDGWRLLPGDAPLTAAKKNVHLTLEENPESNGFVIELTYPGGRE